MFTKHVSAKLSAYINGELATEEAQRLREHLLVCQRCRAEYDEIKFGSQLAAKLPEVAAPPMLWAEIEELLDKQQEKQHEPSYAFGSSPRFRLPFFLTPQRMAAIAVFLLVCAVAASVVLYRRWNASGWEVIRLAGAPKIDADSMRDTDKLTEGEYLVTDANSRARITVGSIGQVEIDPNTRIKLVSTKLTDQRLAIERGRLQARISAPPRIFFVDTPSAQAVDLGCAYTLDVDDSGRTILHVTSGWVALETNGHEAKVPVGASCETRPNLGVGTPYFVDATAAFKEALTKIDFENGGAASLRIVLNEARPRDSLTLFNLLYRVSNTERPAVYDKLSTYIPPPNGVTRDGVIGLNPLMLADYRETLEQLWVQETFPALRNVLRGLMNQKKAP